MQGVDDLLGMMLAGALDVRVFDPQQHPAAVPARMQQIENGGSCPADVQIAGWGGGEAKLHGAGHSTIEGRRMSKSRGFSLIEVLVGLLILTIVITTTIAMFVERQRRLRQANEMILAYQALSNEAEIWRRISFAQLDSQPQAFQSDMAIIAPLAPFSTS